MEDEILREWIEKVRWATLLCPARFTYHDVCNALNVHTEQSRARVTAALGYLAAPHSVVVVRRGGSHKPAVYERVALEPFNDAA